MYCDVWLWQINRFWDEYYIKKDTFLAKREGRWAAPNSLLNPPLMKIVHGAMYCDVWLLAMVIGRSLVSDKENMSAGGIIRILLAMTGKQVTSKDIHKLRAMANQHTNIFIFDTNLKKQIDCLYRPPECRRRKGQPRDPLHRYYLWGEHPQHAPHYSDGQVVAFCVVRQETKALLTKFLETSEENAKAL